MVQAQNHVKNEEGGYPQRSLARGLPLSNLHLGPPVERLEEGHPLFSVVCFSRGTLTQKETEVKLGRCWEWLNPRIGLERARGSTRTLADQELEGITWLQLKKGKRPQRNGSHVLWVKFWVCLFEKKPRKQSRVAYHTWQCRKSS